MVRNNNWINGDKLDKCGGLLALFILLFACVYLTKIFLRHILHIYNSTIFAYGVFCFVYYIILGAGKVKCAYLIFRNFKTFNIRT